MKRAYEKETRTFTIGGREQDYTVGAIFEVNGHEVEFTPCTAIATCADETERSSAIFVHDTTDEFGDGDGVIFGVLMPASNEEAEDMIMYEFIDTYYETRETIEF